MKKLLLILLPLMLFAAEPVVTVDDLANVYVDGVNAGQPADVLVNQRAIAPAVNKALREYLAKMQVDTQESATQVAEAASQQELAAAIAARDAANVAASNANAKATVLEAQLAACADYIARLQAEVRRLGGDPLVLLKP